MDFEDQVAAQIPAMRRNKNRVEKRGYSARIAKKTKHLSSAADHAKLIALPSATVVNLIVVGKGDSMKLKHEHARNPGKQSL